MNALSLTLLLAIPALMVLVGELIKWLVIDRRAPARRRREVVVAPRRTGASRRRRAA